MIDSLLTRLRTPTGANPYTGEPIRDKLRCEAADTIERLSAVVAAIDEREDGKPTAWRYTREELVEMAVRARFGS
jgi:hypothetical protein